MKTIKVLFLLFFVTGCSQTDKTKDTIITKTDIEAELSGIEETRSAFENAVKEGNLEAIMKLSTVDIKTVGPGSADWAEMYQIGSDKGPFPYDSIVMSPKETVIVSDSVAYDFGTSKVYYTNSDGITVELKDTFLAILKKGNDRVWRLHREVASSKVID